MKWLKSPARRSRDRSAPGAQVVDLSSWNGGRPDALTPIARPDGLSPIDHTHPVVDPNLADARLAVTQLIAELARSGALDEGTPDVLDRWIERQLSSWEQAVNAQAESRRIIAARLLGVDEENLKRESSHLEGLRERMVRLRQVHAHWRDQLHGHTYAPAPATAATQSMSPLRPLAHGLEERASARVSAYLRTADGTASSGEYR